MTGSPLTEGKMIGELDRLWTLWSASRTDTFPRPGQDVEQVREGLDDNALDSDQRDQRGRWARQDRPDDALEGLGAVDKGGLVRLVGDRGDQGAVEQLRP